MLSDIPLTLGTSCGVERVDQQKSKQANPKLLAYRVGQGMSNLTSVSTLEPTSLDVAHVAKMGSKRADILAKAGLLRVHHKDVCTLSN